MLIQFSFKNFLSFKEETLIDMSAVNAYKEHEYNLINTEKEKFLRVAAIYGANASGKSNFICAFAHFKDIVLKSSNYVENEDEKSIISNYMPFLLQSQLDNSEFQIITLIDGTEYKYGFEYNDEVVVAEWLYKKDKETNRTSIIFERVTDKPIKFGPSVRKECEIFGKQVSSDMLVLSFLGKLRLQTEIFNLIFKEIKDSSVLSSDSFENYNMITECLPWLIENHKDELLEFLHAIDTGIEDITYSDEGKELEVFTWHRDNEGSLKSLSLLNESEGTIKCISIYIVAKAVLISNSILMVDELNVKLHPLLLKFIIDLFHNSSSQAQLIYTTHDTTLLDKRFFRRDQIWFVQKDEFGESKLYALSDFKIRSDASFEKDYLSGVYGGIPLLKDFAIKEEK